METLHALWDAVRSRRDEHRRQARLRREIGEYRTPAEREELLAILARYDMTVEDVLSGREPPSLTVHAETDPWQEAWDAIVLDLSADD
jgi:hypothetical protein